MPEVGFNPPTLAVEFCQGSFPITVTIKQCRGQRDDAGAAAALGDLETQLTHRDRFRQSRVRFLRKPDRPLLGFDILDELIVASQALQPARSRQAALLLLTRAFRGRAAIRTKVNDLLLMHAENPEN